MTTRSQVALRSSVRRDPGFGCDLPQEARARSRDTGFVRIGRGGQVSLTTRSGEGESRAAPQRTDRRARPAGSLSRAVADSSIGTSQTSRIRGRASRRGSAAPASVVGQGSQTRFGGAGVDHRMGFADRRGRLVHREGALSARDAPVLRRYSIGAALTVFNASEIHYGMIGA